MATRAGATRARRQNAIALLTQEHREVKKMFREFAKLQKKKEGADPEQMREIVQQACLALTVHAHPTLSETPMFAAEMGLGSITDLYIPKK